MKIQEFVFNFFSENTYVLYDDTKECVIIDPGCYGKDEKNKLKQFITDNDLKPVLFLNTHCHIDHVLGNKFVADTYGLPLYIHEKELPVLKSQMPTAQTYRIPNVEESPEPGGWLEHGQVLTFGNCSLEVLFTPGHAPGEVSFYNRKDGVLVAGDVLFEGSIGRTDLPGGDYKTLMKSIEREFLSLPDETIVLSGHGSRTTIGKERKTNPFILDWLG